MARHGLSTPFRSSPVLYPSILSSLQPPTKNDLPTVAHHPEIDRRSANYPPNSWDYNFVKSLTSDYSEEKYGNEVAELKEYVKKMINGDMHGLLIQKLELIDSIQRLGLNYHFEKEIKKALATIYTTTSSLNDDVWPSSDLYATALGFRLFREHRYNVSPDVFKRFKDASGNFQQHVCNDAKGLLSLYEASFFAFRNEDILDEAKTFATAYLKSLSFKGEIISTSMQRKVKHALDKPLQLTMQRLEAAWFINTYEQEQNMDFNLLRLAKLDYDKVQSTYQKELSELARWWMELGFDKMEFFRDRLVEHYLWCVGVNWEPRYGIFRKIATKVISLLTVIDDLYDVYGSIEELELFTDFINRWDISEIDKLPNDIRMVLLAVFNLTNEIGYWTLKERNFNIIPYLSKQWKYLFTTYIREARMFHEGYKPTMDEYLNNSVISVGAYIIMFCSYFLTTYDITVEALDYIEQLPSIIMGPCMIARLHNDMVTSPAESERGDITKLIQCYINDTGATEEETKEYLFTLSNLTWKILNEDLNKTYPLLTEPFLSSNLRAARTAYFFYRYVDGHGAVPDATTKDHLISLLVQPFSLD